MSDDWLKEFDPDGPGAGSGEPSDLEGAPIALDSLGIPILEEVVFEEEDYSFDEELTFHSIPEPTVELMTDRNGPGLDVDLELPEEPELLEQHLSELAAESRMEQEFQAGPSDEAFAAATTMTEPTAPESTIQYQELQERLTASIRQELETMTAELAGSIMEELSRELEQQIKVRLKQSLDGPMERLITQAIGEISDNKQG
jgi:hypothetical protein